MDDNQKYKDNEIGKHGFPKSGETYWTVALLSIGVFFSFGVLLMAKGLTNQFLYSGSQEEVMSFQTTKANTQPVRPVVEEDAMEDEMNDPEVVADDIILDLEQMEEEMAKEDETTTTDDLSDLEY